MEQQIQKEKRMEQKECVRIADYTNPQELRVMQITTPLVVTPIVGRCSEVA